MRNHPANGECTKLAVLITNITLAGRSGTEIVTRDLALGLLDAGHQPVVYSQAITGPIARELRAASVPVTDDISTVRGVIDVIHGHHTPTTATALARFPRTPAVFVCHDFVAWHDSPPELPGIRRFVAVDLATLDRLTRLEGITREKTECILNAVDLRRVRVSSSLPEKPSSALLIAKGRGYAEVIARACGARGVSLEVIGASAGRLVDSPEDHAMGKHLVFASARSALEALASGCAVIVCDSRGLAGMVTSERLPSWRPNNFGLRTLRQPITVESVTAEIDRYDVADAAAVSAGIRRDATLSSWITEYVNLYRTVIEEQQQSPVSCPDLMRGLARHLQRWAPSYTHWPWMEERRQLLGDIEALREELYAARSGTRVMRGGTRVKFGTAEARRFSARLGFSGDEHWGVWTDGSSASLLVRIKGRSSDVALLDLEVIGYVPPRSEPLVVQVSANGLALDNWVFADGNRHVRRVEVPKQTILPDGAVWLAFLVVNPRRPADYSNSSDGRQLGLGLISLTVQGSPPATPTA